MLACVGESFVDLTYHGLSLGRRIKLTQIRPSTGFLELPAPMPVGTKIGLATEEGVAIEAVVTQIHEQIGGSDRTPGMMIAPALADGAVASWWRERVSLPELEPPPGPRPKPATSRTRTVVATPAPMPAPAPTPPATITIPIPTGVVPGEPPALPEEPAAAAPASAAAPAASEPAEPAAAEPPEPAAAEPPEGAAELPIVDDGRKTIMMESVDLRALGLEAGASGQLSAAAIARAAEEASGGVEGALEGAADAAPEDGDEGEDEGEDAGDRGDAASAAPAGANGDPRAPILPGGQQKPHGRKRKKRR
jgi:hypothetical protein